MVECWLPYGNTEVYVTVGIKDLLSIAEPTKIEPRAQPREMMASSIKNLGSGERLEGLVRPDCKVAIAVEGTVSPQLAVPVLSYLVEQFVSMIVPKDRVTVIVGNGARARSSKELVAAITGSEDLKGVRFVEHGKGSLNLADVGKTRQGTPVSVCRDYAEATVKVAVGETMLDDYTGFRGAHSAIVPGVSSIPTIEANRRLLFRSGAKPGVVELNPVKEDAIEATKLAGVDLAVNIAISPQGTLMGVHSGALEESWGRAIYELGSSFQVEVEGGADIVILSAGGSRFDFDLYNSVWALRNASGVVKKGATVILLAECPEGLGVDSFTSLAHVDQLSELERRYALGAEALHLLKSTLTRNDVILVSSLPRYLVEPIGFKVARTANDAYDMALENRRGRRTLVMPYGCSTVPVAG
jgi:nickel-dependent lactate racemase